jgi:hypothetical protein
VKLVFHSRGAQDDPELRVEVATDGVTPAEVTSLVF